MYVYIYIYECHDQIHVYSINHELVFRLILMFMLLLIVLECMLLVAIIPIL